MANRKVSNKKRTLATGELACVAAAPLPMSSHVSPLRLYW
jgi:hypothetical protein